MGFFRFLLATLVLASHCNSAAPPFIGVLAVECFFVISGFYIQMIMTEQYMGQPHWVSRFWKSRTLRIFVPYWVIVFCLLILRTIQHYLMGTEQVPVLVTMKHHPADIHTLVAVFLNVFIIGTDFVKQMGMRHEGTSFYWQQLIIPPVWSVSTELLFYIIAPLLLLCRNRVLVCAIVFSIIGKSILLYGHSADIFNKELAGSDGLLNGFFPLEIGVFSAGALGYRLYKAYPVKSQYMPLLVILILLTTAVFFGLKTDNADRAMFYYQLYLICIIPLVPFLFAASHSLRLDRYIGDLSYPFYLIHHYFVDLMYAIESKWHHHLSRLVIVGSCEILTVLSAILIVKCVETPLSLFRHRHFRVHHSEEKRIVAKNIAPRSFRNL